MTDIKNENADVVIVGAGPAGLMAAERAALGGREVHVFDAMPSVGRKFLLAGKGGLNLTHSEEGPHFLSRFAAPELSPLLQKFGPKEVRGWAQGLGVETFVGTSGRVFPIDMKAAPLLRAWLHRLRGLGVQFHMRRRWMGWDDAGALQFEGVSCTAQTTVLALGGASWPRLGSDGAWSPLLASRGVEVTPLRSANCGFDVAGWSTHFSSRFAGQPFKSVALRFDRFGEWRRVGEFVATATGVEGSLIYAASAIVRDAIEADGAAVIELDLRPDLSYERVLAEVRHPRGSRSLSSHLKSRLGIDGIKAGILYECLSKDEINDLAKLAHAIKAVPIRLLKARPVAEAISTAGGVAWAAVDANLMLNNIPNVYCAGEMLDWEAPTGGYLLTACLATGWHVGEALRKI